MCLAGWGGWGRTGSLVWGRGAGSTRQLLSANSTSTADAVLYQSRPRIVAAGVLLAYCWRTAGVVLAYCWCSTVMLWLLAAHNQPGLASGAYMIFCCRVGGGVRARCTYTGGCFSAWGTAEACTRGCPIASSLHAPEERLFRHRCTAANSLLHASQQPVCLCRHVGGTGVSRTRPC